MAEDPEGVVPLVREEKLRHGRHDATEEAEFLGSEAERARASRGSARQRRAHPVERRLERPEHELRIQTEHPVAEPAERALPPSIGPAPPLVVPTVDLDDELRRRNDEICAVRSTSGGGGPLSDAFNGTFPVKLGAAPECP